MKIKAYMRVANGKATANGRLKRKIAVSLKPNHAPITEDNWEKKPLPTVAFAIELTIPDESFHRAEQVLASLTLSEDAVDVAAAIQ